MPKINAFLNDKQPDITQLFYNNMSLNAFLSDMTNAAINVDIFTSILSWYSLFYYRKYLKRLALLFLTQYFANLWKSCISTICNTITLSLPMVWQLSNYLWSDIWIVAAIVSFTLEGMGIFSSGASQEVYTCLFSQNFLIITQNFLFIAQNFLICLSVPNFACI